MPRIASENNEFRIPCLICVFNEVAYFLLSINTRILILDLLDSHRR